MTNALRKTVVYFTPDENMPPQLNVAERDAEICRLWQAQWTAGKIAQHLDVRAHTVAYVVRKNGLIRKPRGSRIVETVALADAPIEAWQQAVLPELKTAAEMDGLVDAWQRASIILALLRVKPYASIAEFETWAHQVTGYDPAEIALFLQRAKAGHIIGENGQPDPVAYAVMEEPEDSDIAVIIMAGVLLGKFNRTADDKISLAPDQLQRTDGQDVDDRQTGANIFAEPDCKKSEVKQPSIID